MKGYLNIKQIVLTYFSLLLKNTLALQLLALTIQHEKPDLEEQKTKLLQQEKEKKIQLAKLEESLLEVTDIDLI